jgi:hypothetical protein
MLQKEVLTAGNIDTAIETYFCKPFAKLQKHEMNEQLTQLTIDLCVMPPSFAIPEKKKPYLMQIIEKRIEYCFEYKITDQRLLLYIAAVAEKAGTAIMYLWYLQYWCYKNDIWELDYDLFCQRIFPMGFPCDADLEELWYSVKVQHPDLHSGNLLDVGAAGKSISKNQEPRTENQELRTKN